jgi:hypothetical protein
MLQIDTPFGARRVRRHFWQFLRFSGFVFEATIPLMAIWGAFMLSLGDSWRHMCEAAGTSGFRCVVQTSSIALATVWYEGFVPIVIVAICVAIPAYILGCLVAVRNKAAAAPVVAATSTLLSLFGPAMGSVGLSSMRFWALGAAFGLATLYAWLRATRKTNREICSICGSAIAPAPMT